MGRNGFSELKSEACDNDVQTKAFPFENICQRNKSPDTTSAEENFVKLSDDAEFDSQSNDFNIGTLTNHSEAGPDIAEFTAEEFRSAGECEFHISS